AQAPFSTSTRVGGNYNNRPEGTGPSAHAPFNALTRADESHSHNNKPEAPGSSAHTSPRADAVARLVRATCRRQRLAAAAALLTRVALPLGCALAALGVLATRRLDAPAWLAWLGLAPVVVVLVHAAVR